MRARAFLPSFRRRTLIAKGTAAGGIGMAYVIAEPCLDVKDNVRPIYEAIPGLKLPRP